MTNRPKSVSHHDFIPYELEDFAVVIPHSCRMPKRWEWFWPQFLASTPPEIVKNTIVVYHNRDGQPLSLPKNVQRVEEVATLVICEKEGHSIVWPFLAGLEQTRARIVVRSANDVEFSDNWATEALKLYNREPHLKILASLAVPGPAYVNVKRACYAPWLEKLLRHGNYSHMSYIHGSIIIANRAIWLAYYVDLMLDFTRHGGEDIFFTLWSRADGVKVIQFGHFFKHRGPSHQDRIV